MRKRANRPEAYSLIRAPAGARRFGAPGGRYEAALNLLGGDTVARVAGPVEYPLSCSPQAWAAGAVALFVRAMLGAEPDPHKRELFAAPVLPERIEELRLEGVPAFGGRFSLGT